MNIQLIIVAHFANDVVCSYLYSKSDYQIYHLWSMCDGIFVFHKHNCHKESIFSCMLDTARIQDFFRQRGPFKSYQVKGACIMKVVDRFTISWRRKFHLPHWHDLSNITKWNHCKTCCGSFPFYGGFSLDEFRIQKQSRQCKRLILLTARNGWDVLEFCDYFKSGKLEIWTDHTSICTWTR